jgi:hypothetical protein
MLTIIKSTFLSTIQILTFINIINWESLWENTICKIANPIKNIIDYGVLMYKEGSTIL